MCPPLNQSCSVVSNYKITKSESYSQPTAVCCLSVKVVSNYKITKSESYSQHKRPCEGILWVVSNYKITKSESYSQLADRIASRSPCCI